MFCTKCGKSIPDGAEFCTSCGAPVKKAGKQTPAVNRSETGAKADQIASTPTPAPTQAMPTQAAGSTSVGKPPVKKRNGLVIGLASACAVVAVAVAIGAIVLFQPFSGGQGGGEDGGGHSGSLSTVTINGTTIESQARPTIASTIQSVSGMSATPALVSYRTVDAPGASGSTSTGNASSDKQNTGGSGSAGGGSNASTQSDNANASVGTSDSGGIVVQNSFGAVDAPAPAADLSNVVNLNDFGVMSANSSAPLKSALATNQFAVVASDRAEFYDVYEMNRYQNLPSFVTTDSMMHTYHLYFSHLLKNTEKGSLSSELNTLSQAMLQASIDQQAKFVGTEWEEAASRNVFFFSVGCRLLDPAAQTPADIEPTVAAELAMINDASGVGVSALTGIEEDYSQYKPRGYYEGDAQLEPYFRTMMWYGRMNFTQKDESLDRSALLMTIALDGGSKGTVNSQWEAMYTVTSFFAGAADDQTYYEYYPLFAYAYGEGASVDSLAGDIAAWDTYHQLTAQMPAPKINSVAGVEASQVEEAKGFRFMGQRFTIDEATFQQLMDDNVEGRSLPSALDLPAALGSDEALTILDEAGQTGYPGYDTQMEAVRTDIANADDSVWTASLYSQWLYTLNPLLVSKGEGYPAFMQSAEWDKKNLQSYLGSYTELKHDTVLYSKQAISEMGGGPKDKDDRGYVEPEPELYARLANLTQATSDGLSGYGMLSQADADNLARLNSLATQLQTISEKELSGEALTTDEYELIRSYGGQLEHFWQEVNPDADTTGATASRQSPAALVVDIASDVSGGTTLEEATGTVSSIYVLVPIDGELHLCVGGTFSYYEFNQPASNRLTDSSWREMLGLSGSYRQSATKPEQPAWTQSFTVNTGQ